MNWAKPFWTLLAIYVLIQTWIWDRVGPIIKTIISLIPLEKIKREIEFYVRKLPPYPTLLVFVIPDFFIIPFKIYGLKLFATGHFIWGLTVFGVAKVLLLGFSAYLFQVCKPKLLEIWWLKWFYDHWLIWLEWAKSYIDPIKENIRAILRKWRSS